MFYREAGQYRISYAQDSQIFPLWQDRLGMVVMLFIAFVVIPYSASDYWLSALLIPWLILSLVALGQNILMGYAGQLSLGAAGFMAVGAFACYNFILRIDGIPFVVAVILSVKSISTLLASERGAVTKGSIEFRGQRTDKLTPGEMVGMGLVQVMEGRHCFGHLTVEENLITGAYTRPLKGAQLRDALDRIYAYFPRLKVRRTSLAGYTSGGEQQMTAIGRAMMAKPNMLLLDESSMGLAPQIVAEIFEIVRDLNQKEGVSILLAEQNTNVALKYADYGYILESGRIMLDGPAKALAENKDVKEFYLGLSTEGRKSFRDRKSYRRRKRWF
jgi:branched-chain amino acid transport system ATP-binding protein